LTMNIPSTNRYVGGAFTFVRNFSSANVTQIIITEQGTVNANSNLSNVVLFFKTEATCSTSIPPDATQYNSSSVGFNVSEKATVTGTETITVGTSQICVYVRLNVGSGAFDGQTLEIEISNPSTEVTVSAGTVIPAIAKAIDGSTTLQTPKGYEMGSNLYRILSSSINIGGHSQASLSYRMQDTIGEIATDESQSDFYKLKAGYQATWSYPLVSPVLTFSITNDKYTAALGILTTSAAKTDTTGFTVATNADSGYIVTISGNTLTYGSNDIDAIGGTAAFSSLGNEQLGINLVYNSDPEVGANPSGGSGQAYGQYAFQNKFAFQSGDTIADCSTSCSDTTTFNISYLGNISNSTVAGGYSTVLTLIATGTF